MKKLIIYFLFFCKLIKRTFQQKSRDMNESIIKKSISVFRIAVCTCTLVLAMSKPGFATISSIAIDAKTGNVISSSDADSLRYPASLTKLMTLYITFDALEKGLIRMEDKLPVSKHAAGMAPSKLGVRAGEKIRVKDAVMALVVKSANDCAVVLAEGLGYSEANFAKTMTKVARELGMKNTTFKNASGLPNKQQKTTARDMAILGAAMYHHFPKYYKLFATRTYTYKNQKLYTHNHLLKNFQGADGMKTGFTNASGYNIVTSAKRDGNRVIAVTMGHNTARVRDQKVAQLMNQGLKKLAMDTKVSDSNLYAAIEEPIATTQIAENEVTEPQQLASAETSNPANNWAVQLGAFSNYAKARNYALAIKREVSKKTKNNPIDIEPYQNGSAVIYRSKIIGFAKNEAATFCKKLKQSNKSCIVVASGKTAITLANKF